MKKAIPAALAGVLVLTGCCGLFQSGEARYKKAMECALRVSDERSLEILKKGMYCCAALPPDVRTLPEARRFYLEKALALKPEDPEALESMARSFWDEGSYDKALAHFERLRRASPAPLSAVIGEVTMYRLLGQWDKAGPDLEWIRSQKGVDGEKIADYLEGRLLYDQGKLKEAEPLFRAALEREAAGNDYLGRTPYTMRDARFYLAQIKLKGGDAQGAYEEFKLFLRQMGNPDFQIFYAYWLPILGKDQTAFYQKIEGDWLHVRQ
jgi:tetratricopeptide (TPR) repeat protein